MTQEQSLLKNVVSQLCEPSSYIPVWHHSKHKKKIPSVDAIREVMELLQQILFPGFFGANDLTIDNMPFYLGAKIDELQNKLEQQVKASICFAKDLDVKECVSCEGMAEEFVVTFLKRLPQLRALLSGDVKAAYEGDPAALNLGEIIFCYPSLLAMTYHRVAHEFYKMKIPVLPRIISEISHSKTGIDIHPGAQIGEEFFIDHGTGTVIGETCIIGKGCRIYQGVTLGAISFPKESDGTLVKSVERHPILEDNVTIYSNATVLGRIVIGVGSTIGGNVWITKAVPANSFITLGCDEACKK